MAITIDSIFTCSQFTVKNPVFETNNRDFGVSVSSPRKISAQLGRNKGNVKVRASVGSIMQDVEKLEGILGIDVVSEGELKNKGFLGMRKTKLVCTIGPSCCSSEDLEKLALGGMNVARLNMCHGTREWHCDVIRRIKRLNQEKGFCVSVMIDTEGSQIHVVDHGSPSSVKAEEGSTWLFTTNKFEGSDPFTAQASDEGFSEGIVVGDGLVIDGGMASFEVIEKIGSDLRCKCTDSGIFLPRAKLSFWRDGRLVQKKNEHPTISTKDWADIKYGISEGVDFIALSFVNDANAVKQLKNYLITKSSNPIRVLAKIESLESLSKLEEIIEASDGIMVARGDLGVEIPLEQIPTVQEHITKICRQLNKPVIVASQLLESMIEYPIPTRAEVADVSEAVRQYADALMLSGESAIGLHGEKALSVLRMASSRMELWSREENRQSDLHQRELATSLAEKMAEQICYGAAEMANNLSVDAIFVYTKHGQIASLMSRNRPNSPIFAFTNENSTRMALTLQWGVTPVLIDLSDDMEANIMKTVDFTKTQGIVKKGDTVLVVSDIIPTRASSNLFQSIQVKIVA